MKNNSANDSYKKLLDSASERDIEAIFQKLISKPGATDELLAQHIRKNTAFWMSFIKLSERFEAETPADGIALGAALILSILERREGINVMQELLNIPTKEQAENLQTIDQEAA